MKAYQNLYITGSISVTGSGITGSLFGTASNADTASLTVTASNALTASSANDFFVRGDLMVNGTASFKQVNFVSSSTIFESGSTQFGNTSDDTHQFTGSMYLSGESYVTNNQVRWVPTHSLQGPGLSIQVFSSASGPAQWVEIGYFAE